MMSRVISVVREITIHVVEPCPVSGRIDGDAHSCVKALLVWILISLTRILVSDFESEIFDL